MIKDAVAAAPAEIGPEGAASDRDEAIALILGTGTGGASCRRNSDGRFDFPDALADLGHHQVDPLETEPCNCGSRGRVELSTSGTGVVRNFNRRAWDASLYAAAALSLALLLKNVSHPLNLPIAPQEMVLAIWLIVKGFDLRGTPRISSASATGVSQR